MFRIHRSENGEVVFTISGRIDAAHIAELETLIAAETKGRRIILDLKDVSLTGQNGIDFLTRVRSDWHRAGELRSVCSRVDDPTTKRQVVR
jgi:anti-anti-sigma regulatory factor